MGAVKESGLGLRLGGDLTDCGYGGATLRAGERMRNPILDLPLSAVVRREIALPLQRMLHLPTVGALLRAWQNPRSRRAIEQVFDSPEQARHAVTVCAAWFGVQCAPSMTLVPRWWVHDEPSAPAAMAA
jgi:hypothetical protein